MLERVRKLSFRQVFLVALAVLGVTLVLGVAMFYAAGFRSISEVNWLAVVKRHLATAPLLVGYTIQFLIFLLPGACVIIHFSKRRSIPSHHILPAAITASALAGYAAFWIYFASPLTGKVFSAVFELSCFVYFLKNWKSRARSILLERDVYLPLLLYFFAGLFYVGFLWMYDRLLTPDVEAQSRFIHMMPPDNVLPVLLAEQLYHGGDPRPLFADWLSSDRPPLQAGLSMLQRPFRVVRWDKNYQLLGTIYQAVWIPVVWSLLRSVRYSERQVAWTLGVCLLSGFFLINNVYVWPKLLSAGFVVWSFTLLWEPLLAGRKPGLGRAATAALAAALGFLSHGGVAFTLVALGILFIIPRFFIGWKQAILGCAVFALAYFPWTLYQKYYEPPANRLLKLYLAGVYGIDERSTFQAIKDNYASKTFGEILEIKKSNVLLMGVDLSGGFTIERWQANEFFRVMPGLGAVNIGWFGFLLYWLRTRKGNGSGFSVHAERSAAIFVLVGFMSLAVWWLLLGGSDLAVIHQGSYATMMLLFVGLSGCTMMHLPRLIQILGLLVMLADFFVMWVFSTPRDLDMSQRVRRLNLVMALTVSLSAVGLIYVLRKTRQSFDETDRTPSS
jgi:hypothetical protein